MSLSWTDEQWSTEGLKMFNRGYRDSYNPSLSSVTVTGSGIKLIWNSGLGQCTPKLWHHRHAYNASHPPSATAWKKTLSMNVITKHFVKDHPQYKSMSQQPNLQCDVWTCLDTPNTYKQRVLQMGMEQIITRGMRHARQGETGHFSHRLPVCSSSNQAFRSPFSHLGYGWIFLGWKASVESVVLQTFLFLLNLHILPYAFYDLATNTIPTKVVW